MGAGAYEDYAAGHNRDRGVPQRPPAPPPEGRYGYGADRADRGQPRDYPSAQDWAPQRGPDRRYGAGTQGDPYEAPARGEPRQADPYLGGHARELAHVEEAYGQEGYDQRRAPPPHYPEAYDDGYGGYEGEVAPERKPRRRAPLILLGALVGVAVVAGGAIYLYSAMTGDSGEETPPVISAPKEPSKLEPEESASQPAVPRQNKLIYDRILGEGEEQQERIVPRAEEPMSPDDGQLAPADPAQSPADDGSLPVPMPPPPPGSDSDQSSLPTFESGQANGARASSATVAEPTAASGASSTPPAPGELDAGTSGSGTQTASAGEQAQTSGNAAQTATASTLTTPPPVPKPKPAVTASRSASSGGQSGPVPLTPEASAPAAPDPGQVSRASNIASANDPFVDEPGVNRPGGAINSASETTNLQGQQQQQAAREPPQAVAPPTAPSPSTTTSSAASGAYVIQMASYRNEADASAEFSRLRQRYPDLLGNYNPLIQKADLGSRGTFYRLRIGPVASRETASRLCTALIASGEKDCLVRSQ